MPYSPRTWVSGEQITAAKLNNIEAGIQAVPSGAVNTAALVADAATAYAYGECSANVTTASTTYVDYHANTTFSYTTTGGRLVIDAFVGTYQNDSNANTFFAIHVNGTDYGIDVSRVGAGLNATVAGRKIVTLAAGTYTIKLRWKVSGGTASSNNSSNSVITTLTVTEHKR